MIENKVIVGDVVGDCDLFKNNWGFENRKGDMVERMWGRGEGIKDYERVEG